MSGTIPSFLLKLVCVERANFKSAITSAAITDPLKFNHKIFNVLSSHPGLIPAFSISVEDQSWN
jgi:hypothetical protein